jgi:hypothetical protein
MNSATFPRNALVEQAIQYYNGYNKEVSLAVTDLVLGSW